MIAHAVLLLRDTRRYGAEIGERFADVSAKEFFRPAAGVRSMVA
jgi:hypothetical protein